MNVSHPGTLRGGSIVDTTRAPTATAGRGMSYIMLGATADSSQVSRSDAVGLFEANLTPSDEIWNRPNFLLEVVRSTQHALNVGRDIASPLFSNDLPSTFVRATAASVAGLVKQSAQPDIRASTPVGIWKGEIKSIEPRQRTFSAELTPLRGSDLQVAGDISFDQINEDDFPMILPGAIFYLEQYARTVKRQVSYDTIVRFRRGNAWTAEQVQKVSKLSDRLASKMSEGFAKMKIAD